MNEHRLMIDNIRAGTLLHFIEETHRKTGEHGQFRYEGDGLRFITDEDTVINDWTPRQVEEALRELELIGKVSVGYRPHATHTSEYHVQAFPLKEVYPRDESEWRNLSLEELTKLVQTNDEFCAKLVFDLWERKNSLSTYFTYISHSGEKDVPDERLFADMAQDLLEQNGITPRQLAICRMRDETGVPRLARYKQTLDDPAAKVAMIYLLRTLYHFEPADGGPIEFLETEDGLWLIEDGLPSDRHYLSPVEALEALEKAGNVTGVREGHRVIITSFTVPEHIKIAFQDHVI